MSKKNHLLPLALVLVSTLPFTACELVAEDTSSSSEVALSSVNKQSSATEISSAIRLSSWEGSSANSSSSEAQSSEAQVSSTRISSSDAISSSLKLSSSYSSSSILSSSSNSRFGTLIDSRDNQAYKTIQIGSQTWMAENLNFGTLDASSNTVQNAGQKYCYQNSTKECAKGGGLYQWHVAMNLANTCASQSCANQVQAKHQGICPMGWHIPTPNDWKTLGLALGGLSNAGATMKLNNTPWSTWNKSFNDGNSSGFSGYPNGLRYFDGTFRYHGSESSGGPVWWTSEEWSSDARNAHRFYVNNLDASLATNINHSKKDAMSVRCVKD
jgi:uncharacterized protein (TIGR02145 family)